jgi:hypothetical protein
MAAPCGFSIWTEKLYDGQPQLQNQPQKSLMNTGNFKIVEEIRVKTSDPI